ncbi:MAG: hypothetical protein EXR72_07710 [Myxococcales bacterium]|nr:hypothetical protein [Myxococcales bacterium]
MRSTLFLVLIAALVGGCSSDVAGPEDEDLAGGSADGGAIDAAKRLDSAKPADAAVPDGGAVTSDGAVASDASAVGGDLAGPADLGKAGDLATPPTVRFAAIGDTGQGNAEQKQVAAAVAARCAKDGCDFVQLLGDNIYDTGVTSVNDAQWQSKFEEPYMAINLPFYAILGNHDYGGNGAGNEFNKGKNEVDYTAKSMKWKMPAPHYHHAMKHVEFFALDTNLQMYFLDGMQKTDVKGWIAASKAQWKIALGHHPYLSNGPHGNAGSYDGLPLIPIANGQGVKNFMDEAVCGQVDVYLCGHDHSRQWLKSTCKNTELIVSGAGASVTDLNGKNLVHYQANTIGFVYVVIAGNTFTADFVDVNGKVEFTRTLTK